jgi:hypothetical protein
MRTAYVWVSTWPAATILHHVLVALPSPPAAFYRIRHKVSAELRILLLGIAAIGLLSMPLSWLLLEHFKLATSRRRFPAAALAPWDHARDAVCSPRPPLRTVRGAWKQRSGSRSRSGPSFSPFVETLRGDCHASGCGRSRETIRTRGRVAAFVAIPVFGGVVNYPQLHTPELADSHAGRD